MEIVLTLQPLTLLCGAFLFIFGIARHRPLYVINGLCLLPVVLPTWLEYLGFSFGDAIRYTQLVWIPALVLTFLVLDARWRRWEREKATARGDGIDNYAVTLSVTGLVLFGTTMFLVNNLP